MLAERKEKERNTRKILNKSKKVNVLEKRKKQKDKRKEETEVNCSDKIKKVNEDVSFSRQRREFLRRKYRCLKERKREREGEEKGHVKLVRWEGEKRVRVKEIWKERKIYR